MQTENSVLPPKAVITLSHSHTPTHSVHAALYLPLPILFSFLLLPPPRSLHLPITALSLIYTEIRDCARSPTPLSVSSSLYRCPLWPFSAGQLQGD